MVNKIEQFLNDKNKLIELLKDNFSNIDIDILKNIIIANKYYNTDDMSYVYFLKNNNTGLTKIGVTNNLINRIKSIYGSIKNNIGEEHELKLVTLIPIHNKISKKIENEMHALYKDKRKYGEWFDLSNEDDIFSIIDSFEYVDGTLVVLDNSYDIFDNLNMNFEISDDDLLYFMNIETDNYWYKCKSEYINLYKTCERYNVGFYSTKYNYDCNLGVTKKTDSYCITGGSKIYNIEDVKRLKLKIDEIKDIIKWLN